jgi:hypothetical protein
MKKIPLLVAALILASAGAANAEVIQLQGTLTGASEVPPNQSTGEGKVSATFDTVSKQFKYQVNSHGISGRPTAAHFHGPAAAGANAPPVLPIPSPAAAFSGTATLTDAQAADLLAGRWYLNIHTAAHPGGELRAQITR